MKKAGRDKAPRFPAEGEKDYLVGKAEVDLAVSILLKEINDKNK